MGDMRKDGLESTEQIDDIRVWVVTYEGNSTESQISISTIKDTAPAMENNQLPIDQFYEYSWEKWNEPDYHERLKQSYYIMQDEFSRYK